MECILCSEDFDFNARLPMALPCQHTLCAQCMETLNQRDRNKCPTCRTEYQAPNVKVNFGMRDMLQALERTNNPRACASNAESESGRNYFVNGRAVSTSSGTPQEPSIPPTQRRIFFLPGRLGLGFRDTIIADVCKGGQAEMHGVAIGWGITAVNGQFARSQEHLEDILAAARSRPYFVTFNVQAPMYSVTFEKGPMGVNLRNRIVCDVKLGGQAAALGIQRGWGIQSVNGQVPNNQDELTGFLERARDQRYEVTFDMNRWKSWGSLMTLWRCKYVDPRIERLIEWGEELERTAREQEEFERMEREAEAADRQGNEQANEQLVLVTLEPVGEQLDSGDYRPAG